MLLSTNFSLWEFEKSDTALRHGIRNHTPPFAVERLRILACRVLQPCRDYFGKPIKINSGYRSPELNALVKGSKTSQHMKGEAADIELMNGDNWELLDFIKEHLEFDQLIAEYMQPHSQTAGWVHVSYREGANRNQFFEIG